jgi:hypothetical protein
MEKKAIDQDYVLSAFDYQDGQLIRKIGRINEVGSIAGCVHKGTGYIHIKINAKAFKAHRLIFLYHYGYFPEFVDHIDGNKQNNRIENLREANKQENSQNQKVRWTNSSGVKGVSWHKVNKKWKVALCKNYRSYYFGTYEDKELAELVSMEATDLLHENFSAYKGVLNGKQA